MPQTLSVLTAAHGGKLNHLHDTYQSLCNQELPDGWEVEWILLIDSGHSYYFPDDVYIAQGAIARVEVSLGDRHHGPNVLRNIGLASSTGNIIKVLDADDILLPGALTRDITILTEQPETDFVVSAVYDMSENGETMHTPAHLPAWQPFTHHPTNEGGMINSTATIDFAITNFIPFHPVTLCARKQAIYRAGGWSALPFAGDVDFFLTLTHQTAGYYLDTHSLGYRRWDGNMELVSERNKPTNERLRKKFIREHAQALQKGK